MSDQQLQALRDAMAHQFDEDENADLVIDTNDPVLRAAVRIINELGGHSELTLAADPHFLRAIEIAQEERPD